MGGSWWQPIRAANVHVLDVPGFGLSRKLHPVSAGTCQESSRANDCLPSFSQIHACVESSAQLHYRCCVNLTNHVPRLWTLNVSAITFDLHLFAAAWRTRLPSLESSCACPEHRHRRVTLADGANCFRFDMQMTDELTSLLPQIQF